MASGSSIVANLQLLVNSLAGGLTVPTVTRTPQPLTYTSNGSVFSGYVTVNALPASPISLYNSATPAGFFYVRNAGKFSVTVQVVFASTTEALSLSPGGMFLFGGGSGVISVAAFVATSTPSGLLEYAYAI